MAGSGFSYFKCNVVMGARADMELFWWVDFQWSMRPPFELAFGRQFIVALCEYDNPVFAFIHRGTMATAKWRRALLLGKSEDQNSLFCLMARQWCCQSEWFKQHGAYYLDCKCCYSWQYKSGFTKSSELWGFNFSLWKEGGFTMKKLKGCSCLVPMLTWVPEPFPWVWILQWTTMHSQKQGMHHHHPRGWHHVRWKQRVFLKRVGEKFSISHSQPDGVGTSISCPWEERQQKWMAS